MKLAEARGIFELFLARTFVATSRKWQPNGNSDNGPVAGIDRPSPDREQYCSERATAGENTLVAGNIKSSSLLRLGQGPISRSR
ncbi:MAG: hypothetical protein ONB53_08665, partial [candidate division KSB1 bacterium]|nr:hypothetical protein [candidate division KSB1 bacterium]MDZ7417062.1 hypothetical protein [candidate division KSB1 bacterium]